MTPTTSAQVAEAARKVLVDNRGRAWPNGAVVDRYYYRTPAQQRIGKQLKSFCVNLDDLCSWIAEVERAIPDRPRAAQAIRRLWYSPAVYGSRFDQAIKTDTTLTLSADLLRQSCIDGLARSGMLALTNPVQPDAVVDVSHVFVMLDWSLNGQGPQINHLKQAIRYDSALASPEAMLSWQADLASIFTGFQTERARWVDTHPGQQPQRGDLANPTVPDTEAFWLATSVRERSPISDLLGDLDGVLLGSRATSGASLADLVHDYYHPSANAPADVPIVATRFAEFLKKCTPNIPFVNGMLTQTASATILKLVTDGSLLLLRAARAEKHRWYGAVVETTKADITVEYAAWCCREVATRFEALLNAGLSGGSLAAAWPTDSPDPINVGYPPVLFGGVAARLAPNAMGLAPTAVPALEAAAQHYVNSPDPWGTPPPSYTIIAPVLLGDLTGTKATALPDQTMPGVVLADLYDPAVIWPALGTDAEHRDLLWLAAATSRPSKTYRIVAVDPVRRVVSLDADPQLGNSPGAWVVIRRPQLVLVDAWGPRPHLSGTLASAGAAIDEVFVNVDDEATRQALTQVNCGLDTIVLDTVRNIPRLPFRILSMDLSTVGLAAIRVDRPPMWNGATSWQIPEGLGGAGSAAATAAKNPAGTGADHYDGMLSVVYRGVITKSWPWTTFPTFVPDANGDKHLDGLSGNRQYDAYSYRGSHNFENFCFAVRPPTQRGSVFSDDSQLDQVPVRDYLTDVSTLPAARVSALATTDTQQGEVRVHYGNPVAADGTLSTGSPTCLVSPDYYQLRAELIRIHQLERRTVGQPDDADLAALGALTDHQAAEELWESGAYSSGEWQTKVVASLTVIRPDERPLVQIQELKPWVD